MARLKQTFPQWRDSARGMTWIHRFSGESYWHLTLTCKAHQPLVLRGGHSLDVEIERQRLESNRFLYPWKHLSNEFSEENNMLFEIIRNILDGYNSPNNHIKVSGNLRWDDSWETPSFHQKLSISWLTNRRSRLRKVKFFKCNPQLLWCQQICFTVLPFYLEFLWCQCLNFLAMKEGKIRYQPSTKKKLIFMPEVPMGRKSSS